MFSAVYEDVSGVNHRCLRSGHRYDRIANTVTQPRFDVKTFAIQFRALCNIKAGDEILALWWRP